LRGLDLGALELRTDLEDDTQRVAGAVLKDIYICRFPVVDALLEQIGGPQRLAEGAAPGVHV
jgi:hypothetical protein